ncbi:MAG: hypothetical protein ACYCUG_04120, partial [Acidimicrobiales bacterium]
AATPAAADTAAATAATTAAAIAPATAAAAAPEPPPAVIAPEPPADGPTSTEEAEPTQPAETPTPAPSAPAPPAAVPPDAGAERPAGQPDVYTAEELAAAVGCEPHLVRELQQYGLIAANATVGGIAYFDPGALGIVGTGAGFSTVGVEPRHLRAWRNAADREASLYEQLVMPLLRQRNPQARRQAAELLERLAALGGELRAGLVGEAIRQIR